MRRVLGLGVMLALVLFQVTWAPRFTVAGAFPNLVLIAVIAITWAYGARSGLVWACVGGVLLDLTAAGAIGPHALALLVGVYAASRWARDLERPNAVHLVLTAGLSTVLYAVVLVLTDGLLGAASPDAGTVARLTVAAAVYNAVLMPFAMEALRRLRLLAREDPAPA